MMTIKKILMIAAIVVLFATTSIVAYPNKSYGVAFVLNGTKKPLIVDYGQMTNDNSERNKYFVIPKVGDKRSGKYFRFASKVKGHLHYFLKIRQNAKPVCFIKVSKGDEKNSNTFTVTKKQFGRYRCGLSLSGNGYASILFKSDFSLGN